MGQLYKIAKVLDGRVASPPVEIRHKRRPIGAAKDQMIVSDGNQGTRMEDVAEAQKKQSALAETSLKELASVALLIEKEFDGVPQDIELAISAGKLWLLQSRPITNLPVQPIDVQWVPTPPAQYLSRRQIVENMPDPLCPLFEELYLTEGLESTRKGESLMVGGGPLFITMNGYAYMRFDFPQIINKLKAESEPKPVTEAEIEAEENKAAAKAKAAPDQRSRNELMQRDVDRFAADLSAEDRATFDAWVTEQDNPELALKITFPDSKNLTYIANNNTENNNFI